MRGVINVLPLFGFQNLQCLAFPLYSKIMSQILQKLSGFKEKHPKPRFFIDLLFVFFLGF